MKDFMNYNFNVTSVTTACFVPSGKGLRIHTDRPAHGVALNLGGVKVYEFSDGRRIKVGANEIVYLPKGSTYEVTAEENGDCYAVNFLISEEVDIPPLVVKVKDKQSILEHFKTARKEWETRRVGFEMRCKAELYGILSALQRDHAIGYLPKSKAELIRPAVEYIHEHYTEETVSISYLSELCGITPEYFRRIFGMIYGTSPVKYVISLKIARAKELIQSRTYNVTEAAAMSGFTDMSYFSRVFKKTVGVPPSKI